MTAPEAAPGSAPEAAQGASPEGRGAGRSGGDDGAQGLSAAEVADRVRQGLTNAYEERTSRSVAQILRANLLTVFNAILGVALVLVLVFGHWADALFGIVLLLNTGTGTVAEIRAKRALDRLAVLEAPRASVVRDGEVQEVAVAEVVLDDVVRVRAGEQVPADGTVVSADGLEVDESILTGESSPVRPVPGGRVMSGTTVTAGTGLFRATAVGADAYAHRLAREARRYSVVASELQAGTNRVLGWISWVIVPVALLLAWSQLRGEDGGAAHALASGTWRSAVVPAVAGVVGMVPQGLVLLTSVNFATAALALARRRVLVQELPAVEVLARVDTLCLDKTGTITTGRIRLERVEDLDQLKDLGLLEDLPADLPDGVAVDVPEEAAEDVPGPGHEVLTALARLSGGEDPNASAAAISDGLGRPDLLGAAGLDAARALRPEAQVPFSSRRKWSALRVEGTTWVLGAPEILLDAAGADCPGPLVARARERVGQAAATGARVLALAASPQPWSGQSGRAAQSGQVGQSGQDPVLPTGLRPRALVVLAEEVRPDAAQTLSYFRDQGVEVKVISGDNPATVAAVARRAGVQAPGGGELAALDARELPAVTAVGQAGKSSQGGEDGQDGQGDRPGRQEARQGLEDLDALAEVVEPVSVLGRVTPEQKRSLVRALRSRGHVVAMTGDGVNDALALKEADLGIAMGSGAPATRAVARLVLMTGEFSALPGVVAQGRRVMANTERIASLFLAKTVYASLIAVVVSALAISYPFAPRQLTIVSSLTIGVPAFVLALAPSSQRYRAGFLDRVLTLAVPAGLVAGTATLLARAWLALTGAPEEQVTTGATLVLVASGLWLLTLTARPLLGWRLGLVLLMGATAVLGVVCPPVRAFFLLSWPQPGVWWVTAVMAAVAVGGIEAVYLLRQRLAHG